MRATVFGLALVLPFVLLEAINRRRFDEDFPFPLFGILWLLPVAFFVLLTPIVRHVRAGHDLLASPAGLLLRVVALGLLAWFWGGILVDQMPCFLGEPHCD